MIDPLSPIQGFYEAEYPILPVGQKPVPPPEVTQAQAAQPETADQGLLGIPVDYNRLKQDEAYFIQLMKYVLYKARVSFNKFIYADAEQLYGQFFKYLRAYRANAMYGSPIEYYPALFEYSWTLSILNRRKEAEKILNQELLRLLEPVLVRTPAHLSDIRNRIQQLQVQNLFPSQPHQLTVRPDLVALQDIARQLAKAGEAEFALHVLSHVEVRHLLSANQIRQLAGTIAKASGQTGAMALSNMLSAVYSRLGLPVTPTVPLTPEEAEKIRSKTFVPEHQVDRVNPIDPTTRDPRKQEFRGARQRSRKASAKKGKVLRGKRKPRITL